MAARSDGLDREKYSINRLRELKIERIANKSAIRYQELHITKDIISII